MNDMDPPTSRLHSVKIQGFKSYAGSVDILDLGSFTCIIGANGAGKSVTGDAIAFVLGHHLGLRKKELLKLMNDSSRCRAPSPDRTQVCLTFLVGQELFSCARRLSMSGRSEPLLACSSSQGWHATDEDTFCKTLGEHGIRTDNLKRCILKQQDQAVKVHHPLLLTEHFEALVGTSGYVVSISETRQHLSDKHTACEGLEVDIDRLERRRTKIRGQVRSCEEYLQRRSTFLAQQRAFLKQKHAYLQADILALQHGAKKASEAVQHAAGVTEHAKQEKEIAQAALCTAERALGHQKAAEQAHLKEAQDLMLEESRLGIHLKTAKADAKMAGIKAKRNARRLHELTAKEDRARAELAELNESHGSLIAEESKHKAAIKSLQDHGLDTVGLVHLEMESKKASAELASLQSLMAEKEQVLSSLQGRFTNSQACLEKQRSSLELLEVQGRPLRADMPHLCAWESTKSCQKQGILKIQAGCAAATAAPEAVSTRGKSGRLPASSGEHSSTETGCKPC
ncbi:hypothetical protein CVIRNUC_005352 [Coccomyxa viridis]|uniref:RecF/RecN/SMC N-terminal domain-containing protein n=1 Tax=Coccomyxa viridis TaxID=1274662 RepID=A0AAV1I436_9CHLO|nr:hypothetical protein CVIRNUC_005352 [Coccomyxa viridis]